MIYHVLDFFITKIFLHWYYICVGKNQCFLHAIRDLCVSWMAVNALSSWVEEYYAYEYYSSEICLCLIISFSL